MQLKQDAAASLGTNHLIFKVAAKYIDAHDKQMTAALGISLSEWQSDAFLRAKIEKCKLREEELLAWAGIDLADRTV